MKKSTLFFSILGKCYNFPDNYLPRRNRSPLEDGAATKHESRDLWKADTDDEEDEDDEDDDGDDFVESLPAILPYEAKQAVLRNQRELDLEPNEVSVDPGHSSSLPLKRAADSTEHFLYGNMPVVEYRLSDGSGGTVGKTPR